MAPRSFYFIGIILLIMAVGCRQSTITSNNSGIHKGHDTTGLALGQHDKQDTAITPADRTLLERQRLDLVRSQLDVTEYIDTKITDENADSIAHQINYTVHNGKVVYAPGKRFKLFNYEQEHCGATCFSEWISYVHFEYKNKKVIKELETMVVDSIYKLPDGKYLLLESGFEHPISAYYAVCRAAKIISFVNDSIIIYPIRYRGRKELYLRHDNDEHPDIKPYIKYDPKKQILSYQYISNRSYLAEAPNIDSLRTGQFTYRQGQFVLKSEHVVVTDHRKTKRKNE